MTKLQWVFVLTLGCLTGCGQVMVFGHTIGEPRPATTAVASADPAAAKPAPTVTPVMAAKPGVYVVKGVTLSLSPEAAAKTANDSRFNPDALLEVVKSELRSRQLLDETASGSAAEISIEDFSAKLTSNAVVFGYIISDGVLVGDLQLRDGEGKELPGFAIEATAKMSSKAGTVDNDPLGPLYQRFAVLAADRLAGVASKSNNTRDQLGR